VDAVACLSSARSLRKKLQVMIALRVVMSTLCTAVVVLLFLLPKFDKQHNEVNQLEGRVGGRAVGVTV
jgi:hypothetical protein